MIRSELGDQKVRVAMIGPGGENLVRYACLMHGLYSAAGRGGTGAVMGSKNVKAVAVRGSRMPSAADPEVIKEFNRWLKENMARVKAFSDYGTGGPMPRFEKLGNLPIRNFRDGGFPGVDRITPQTIKETIRVGMDNCFACPVRCKKVVEVREPHRIDRAYGGPEYETLGALGSACGIDDLIAISKGNALCNAHSLDTISTGMSIAFGMECFENGLLTLQDTGGVSLEFGNAGAMLDMIERIARREGIGSLLAEGTARAAEKIGRGAEDFAIHVRKQELPMHEPRLSKSLGLGYMVNPHGADHMDSMIDIFFAAFGEQPNVMTPDGPAMGLEPAPLEEIGPRKVALFKAFQSKRIISDSLVMCDFLPYSYGQLAELTGRVTGWDTSIMHLYRISERILTLFRLFNNREGMTAADDRLPKRFFGPTRGGPLADKALEVGEMEQGKRLYYDLMGWDQNGVPKADKLEELGIDSLMSPS
jgi:aldehyde:ferredoxin oxidoreductase